MTKMTNIIEYPVYHTLTKSEMIIANDLSGKSLNYQGLNFDFGRLESSRSIVEEKLYFDITSPVLNAKCYIFVDEILSVMKIRQSDFSKDYLEYVLSTKIKNPYIKYSGRGDDVDFSESECLMSCAIGENNIILNSYILLEGLEYNKSSLSVKKRKWPSYKTFSIEFTVNKIELDISDLKVLSEDDVVFI